MTRILSHRIATPDTLWDDQPSVLLRRINSLTPRLVGVADAPRRAKPSDALLIDAYLNIANHFMPAA